MPQPPVDFLEGPPSDVAIFHETGHLLMAIDLGIPGPQIEFPRTRVDFEARHVASSEACDPRLVIRMILAGPITHTLSFPSTVDMDLRDKLLAPILFNAPECLENNSDAEAMMSANGFGGDWFRIKKKAFMIQGSNDDRRGTLAEAHRITLRHCRSRRFQKILALIVADIKLWLHNAVDEIPMTPDGKSIVYFGTSAASLLKLNPKR